MTQLSLINSVRSFLVHDEDLVLESNSWMEGVAQLIQQDEQKHLQLQEKKLQSDQALAWGSRATLLSLGVGFATGLSLFFLPTGMLG